MPPKNEIDCEQFLKLKYTFELTEKKTQLKEVPFILLSLN